MTTVHHPPVRGVDFHHIQDWMGVGLSVILVAVLAGTVVWAVSRPDTAGPVVVDAVSGVEYDHEVTSYHEVSPGVTAQYFGYSGEPINEFTSAGGFEVDHEASTGIYKVSPGVTTQYFGYSGEPINEFTSAGGFEVDHEASTGIYKVSPGVTTQYFGYSGELSSDK